MGPAMAALLWGGLCHPRRCDLNPIGKQDIFQYLHISKMWSGAHWHAVAPAHFLPVSEVCLGLAAGLFPPNVGGPLHVPGSLVAASTGSPCCQTTHPGGARINPSPGSGVLAAQSNHYLLLLCGISLWGPERMLAPSWQILGCHLGWEPLRLLHHQASMSNCSACHWIHLVILWGNDIGVQLLSQELFNARVKRGRALQVLFLWSGPVSWVICSLLIPQA